MEKSLIQTAPELDGDKEIQQLRHRHRLGWIVVGLLLYTWLVASLAYSWIRNPTAVPDSRPSGSPRFQLDVNTATAGQLQALPEVGPRIAQRIVADRNVNGPFRSIDELRRVHGMGPKTLDKLRPMLTVGRGASEPLP